MRTKILAAIESGNAYWDSSYPGGAYYYDGSHYNASGEELRPIEEYNTYDPEWTPFGDE